MDPSTLAFFAARALQVREEEEEAEEVRQLEEVVTMPEARLLGELELLRDDTMRPPWAALCPAEQAICRWYAAKLTVSQRRGGGGGEGGRCEGRGVRGADGWLASQVALGPCSAAVHDLFSTFFAFGASHAVFPSFCRQTRAAMVGIFLVVDAPEWQRQVPAVLDVQTVQKTSYFPQLQLLDKFLDEPVVVQRLVLWSWTMLKTV